MKLTAEEAKKIDEALAALKRSLKDELLQVPSVQQGRIELDDEFLKKISDVYFSTSTGLVNLLLDSGIAGGRIDCVCGVTCATPCQYTLKPA